MYFNHIVKIKVFSMAHTHQSSIHPGLSTSTLRVSQYF